MRHSLIAMETRCRNAVYRLRGWLLSAYLRLHGCSVGRGLRCRAWPLFRSIPNQNYVIGDNVSIGNYITFETGADGRIVIEDGVNLTQNIVIVACQEIVIGAKSGIAERVSIRDADHGTARGMELRDQPMDCAPIRIGRSVQVSLGCTILKGANIADNAIICAHTIVGKNVNTVEHGIYFGSPPRCIGKRK